MFFTSALFFLCAEMRLIGMFVELSRIGGTADGAVVTVGSSLKFNDIEPSAYSVEAIFYTMSVLTTIVC